MIHVLGFLNFFVLQWFFVRIAGVHKKTDDKFIGYVLLRWPVPLTGWFGGKFRYIKRTPFSRIWGKAETTE